MLNSNSFAYFITFKVTWLPCPSIINNCQLLKNIPPGIDLLEKDKNSLNKSNHPCSFLHFHTSTWFLESYVIIPLSLTFEDVETM